MIELLVTVQVSHDFVLRMDGQDSRESDDFIFSVVVQADSEGSTIHPNQVHTHAKRECKVRLGLGTMYRSTNMNLRILKTETVNG